MENNTRKGITKKNILEILINKMRLFAISLFNKHLINRKSRIGNDYDSFAMLYAPITQCRYNRS